MRTVGVCGRREARMMAKSKGVGAQQELLLLVIPVKKRVRDLNYGL